MPDSLFVLELFAEQRTGESVLRTLRALDGQSHTQERAYCKAMSHDIAVIGLVAMDTAQGEGKRLVDQSLHNGFRILGNLVLAEREENPTKSPPDKNGRQ